MCNIKIKDTGCIIATYASRICSSEKGNYLEIPPEGILYKVITEREDQLYRNTPEYSHCKYRWFEPIDNSGSKIYLQTKTVNYADYKIGYFYINTDIVLYPDNIPIIWGKDNIKEQTLFECD